MALEALFYQGSVCCYPPLWLPRTSVCQTGNSRRMTPDSGQVFRYLEAEAEEE